MKSALEESIKFKRPIVRMYRTEHGILVQTRPSVKVTEYLTGIISMVQNLVDDGHKLDDILTNIRQFVANGQLEKAKGTN